MAAASAQIKAREEENLAKQTPSVRSVNLTIWEKSLLIIILSKLEFLSTERLCKWDCGVYS